MSQCRIESLWIRIELWNLHQNPALGLLIIIMIIVIISLLSLFICNWCDSHPILIHDWLFYFAQFEPHGPHDVLFRTRPSSDLSLASDSTNSGLGLDSNELILTIQQCSKSCCFLNLIKISTKCRLVPPTDSPPTASLHHVLCSFRKKRSTQSRGRLLNKHWYSVQIAAASPLVQSPTIQFIQTLGCRGYKNCQISCFSNTALSDLNDSPALDVCLAASRIQ